MNTNILEEPVDFVLLNVKAAGSSTVLVLIY
jgi:hypothetical protein